MRPALRRFLLWDYDRGTLPYDLMTLLIVVVLLLAPASCDPMVAW